MVAGELHGVSSPERRTRSLDRVRRMLDGAPDLRECVKPLYPGDPGHPMPPAGGRVILVGTSPGAEDALKHVWERHVIQNGDSLPLIATVNHGPTVVARALGRVPNIWGMWERDAVGPCQKWAESWLACDRPVWGTTRAAQGVAHIHGAQKAYLVWPVLPQRASDAGNALLWAVARELQPHVIYVCGMGGRVLDDDTSDAREQDCHSSIVIERVTKRWRNRTRFVFVGKTTHPDRDRWSAEFEPVEGCG